MPDFIKNKREFFEFLRSNKSVKLKFRKKDGSVRLMNATLNFDEIPDYKKPEKIDKKKFEESVKKGIFTVYDLDEKDWRKVNFNTTDWVESEPNIRYRIKK